MLTGRLFDADMAREFGIVNKVAKKRRWLEEALELAHTVAERPPIATRLAQAGGAGRRRDGLSAGIESERRMFEIAMATEDRVEGMTAFIEKREPKFEGK